MTPLLLLTYGPPPPLVSLLLSCGLWLTAPSVSSAEFFTLLTLCVSAGEGVEYGGVPAPRPRRDVKDIAGRGVQIAEGQWIACGGCGIPFVGDAWGVGRALHTGQCFLFPKV